MPIVLLQLRNVLSGAWERLRKQIRVENVLGVALERVRGGVTAGIVLVKDSVEGRPVNAVEGNKVQAFESKQWGPGKEAYLGLRRGAGCV